MDKDFDESKYRQEWEAHKKAMKIIGNYSPERIEYVLDKDMPSLQMREHLQKKRPSGNELIDMILDSPVSLEGKADTMKKLSEEEEFVHEILRGEKRQEITDLSEHSREWIIKNSATHHYKEITAALDARQCGEGEIILMKEAWYDGDEFFEKIEGGAPFQSWDAAIAYLRWEMYTEEEWDENSLCWTIFEKWVPKQDGTYENPYTFYLIGEEPVYFEKNKQQGGVPYWIPESHIYSSGCGDLNLSVPFHVGDIVKLDVRPFAPVKYAVLLVTNDDCCGLRGLLLENDGFWHDVALKHKHGWGRYYPMLSPLYRMTVWEGDIPGAEGEILKKVQKYLNGDVRKGKQLDLCCLAYDISAEELTNYIAREWGKDEKHNY